MKCERCGKRSREETYELFDYCAECSANLCPACMKKGCCGHEPAKSGQEQDHADNGEDVE